MNEKIATPWLNTTQAAEYLGCSAGTLKTWRTRGSGPRYRIVSRKLVRYHRDDLDSYVVGQKTSAA